MTEPRDDWSHTTGERDGEDDPRHTSRRRFLTLLGGGALAGVGALAIVRAARDDAESVLAPTTSSTVPTTTVPGTMVPGTTVPGTVPEAPAEQGAPVDDQSTLVTSAKTLVLIELRGANDGLATLIPQSDGRLRDLRAELMWNDDEVRWLDDQFAVHPGLAPLVDRGAAFVEGIGSTTPDLSHFVMEQRWWVGDSVGDQGLRTGFLGRLCDHLATEGVAGIALGTPSPYLYSERGVTAAIPDLEGSWFLTEPSSFFEAMRTGFVGMARPGSTDLGRMPIAREGLDDAVTFADLVTDVGDSQFTYPSTPIGLQLRSAAQVVKSPLPVNVIHVDQTGYDTHDQQRSTHDRLMSEFGEAVAVLVDDLTASGLIGNTLIATTSEFGRRPQQNGSGTDHGAASMAMLLGPVAPGRHGESPSLGNLDDNDNMIATVPLESYFATLSEGWFGIPASELLPRNPSLVDGVLIG